LAGRPLIMIIGNLESWYPDRPCVSAFGLVRLKVYKSVDWSECALLNPIYGTNRMGVNKAHSN